MTSVRFIAAVAVVLSVALFTTAVEGQRFFPSARTLEEPCEGGGYNPTPVAVAVTSVPIVVTSTTDEYFVLYVKHDVDGTKVEMPVLVKLGQAGTTTLAENVAALPAERYRVEKYLIADPADVDGDCIDDITELANSWRSSSRSFSETEIRLVRVKLLREGQSRTIPMYLSIALQGSSLGLPISGPSPDFNGNGVVDIPDFLLFVDVFGLKVGQERYETKYDLNGNDEIGIPDFLIFVDHFGKMVSQVPVFTSEPPVMRFVEENTPPGQPIGDPISATSAEGEPLTYSLWGVDAEYFVIDASTGQLETKETHNYETRNWYSPIVRVSDGKGRQVSVVVGVAIIDVAE